MSEPDSGRWFIMKIDISHLRKETKWARARFIPRSGYFYGKTGMALKTSIGVRINAESNLALLIPDLENVRIQLMRIIYNED